MCPQGEDRFQTLADTMAKLGRRLDSSLTLLNAIASLTAVPVKAARLADASREILDTLLRELTGVQSCSILLYDEYQDELRLLTARGQGDLLGADEGPYNLDLSFKPGEGVAGKVFAAGTPVFWSKSARDQDLLKKAPSLFTDPPALASLPLSSLGRRMGVLNISFTEPDEIEQAKRTEYVLLARITANILNAFLQKAELDQFAAILAGRAVRSEQQYQRLFDSALLGIMRFSPLGELIAVNPACARLFGYDSPKEMVRLLAKRQTNLFAEAHQRKRIVDLILKARGTLVLENRYLKRDGEKFAAVLHARAVRDVQGNLLGLEGFIQDAGHARGAAVTAGRLEEELLRAQRMQSVGTLSCGLNQDLSNALTAVEGFTQIARDQMEPDSPARSDMEQALKACDRAQAILLQLQRLTTGLGGPPKVLELAPLIEETLALLRAMVPAHIDIELKRTDRPQFVLAHQSQLTQVAMNLCTNASRAMGDSGGLLRVELDKVELGAGTPEPIPELVPGTYHRISFSDQGPGVNPDLANHIFQPLFTTRENGQGCGMGLATSLSIVKELGGTIVLHAGDGSGAVFMVYLPPGRRFPPGPERGRSRHPARRRRAHTYRGRRAGDGADVFRDAGRPGLQGHPGHRQPGGPGAARGRSQPFRPSHHRPDHAQLKRRPAGQGGQTPEA